ncbi:RNA 2',3'-cyclic phosphodiesterase [Deltaproteobacteria bacterium]|nr:RNA 2',3'-cyclic phosphodiesterase [Deltaproteobacteria bacterium]
MKIRSFISLDLPLSLKHELSGYAKLIDGQDKRQKFSWLPPENYHLTLVFLGDVEFVKISALQLALERKMESTKAVPLTISAITPFPFSRPRIAAALVEHTAEILRLQSDVANCVRKCGITPERRRFVPHLTLGRLKPRVGKTVDFKVRNILLSGFADSVTLFQSELTQDGAIHTALAEIPLKTLPE